MTFEFPEELLKFYNDNKDFNSPIHNSVIESQQDNECAYYPIKFNFDPKLLLDECRSVDHLYFDHRSQDKKKGYGHQGWQSLTLHGIDKDKTEHYTKYGFDTLEEANYHWTDVCELVPNLHKFLSELPYKLFDRVRIMRLAPYGYIMPHSDGKGRIFSPLNIAINKGFKGSGIIINTELINQICLQDEQNSETIIINKILQNKQIILNGHSKYISMILPPKSDFPIIIQLIPWL